jgi:hypothetical protein
MAQRSDAWLSNAFDVGSEADRRGSYMVGGRFIADELPIALRDDRNMAL